jgi:hypothetical protein
LRILKRVAKFTTKTNIENTKNQESTSPKSQNGTIESEKVYNFHRLEDKKATCVIEINLDRVQHNVNNQIFH